MQNIEHREDNSLPDSNQGTEGNDAHVDIFENQAPLHSDNLGLKVFSEEPISYIHDSWYARMEQGELLQRLKSSKRVESYISNEILRQLGLDTISPADVDSSEGIQILIADFESLRCCVWCVGLIVCGTQLRGLISGQDIRRISDSLGESSFQYSVNSRCPFMVSDAVELELQGAFLSQSSLDPRSEVIKFGMFALAEICKKNTMNISRRFALKFPISWAQCLENPLAIAPFEDIVSLAQDLLDDPPGTDITTNELPLNYVIHSENSVNNI